MKRSFTLSLALVLLSVGKLFAQAGDSCVILGCSAAFPGQTTNNALPLLLGGWPGTCYAGGTYNQIYWQFYYADPVDGVTQTYEQAYTLTGTPAVPIDLDWVAYDMGNTAPPAITCNFIHLNKPGWPEVRCSGNGPNNPAGPGQPGGEGILTLVGGEYYAIGIIINNNGADPSPAANFTFDVGAPTKNGGTPIGVNNCSSIILPVKLTSFNARVANCGVVNLDWTAATQTDFRNYEVQYSTNGSSFQTIGTLAADNSTPKYSFTDNAPSQGKVYYRLKMNDLNGSFEYSKTLAMRLNCNKSEIFVYPNPVKDKLNVNITNAQNNVTIAKLFDNFGRLLFTGTLISGTNTIDMTKFSKGVYLLRLNNNNGVQNMKIIK